MFEAGVGGEHAVALVAEGDLGLELGGCLPEHRADHEPDDQHEHEGQHQRGALVALGKRTGPEAANERAHPKSPLVTVTVFVHTGLAPSRSQTWYVPVTPATLLDDQVKAPLFWSLRFRLWLATSPPSRYTLTWVVSRPDHVRST